MIAVRLMLNTMLMIFCDLMSCVVMFDLVPPAKVLFTFRTDTWPKYWYFGILAKSGSQCFCYNSDLN